MQLWAAVCYGAMMLEEHGKEGKSMGMSYREGLNGSPHPPALGWLFRGCSCCSFCLSAEQGSPFGACLFCVWGATITVGSSLSKSQP